tara:strand:+ start:542 stop:853 length:312 start_codon:yes stop_codon:yes gene_type:complete
MNKYPKILNGRYFKKVFKLSITGSIIVLIFTGIFHLFDHTHFNGFGEEDDEQNKILNRLYFTMTTFSSTGYGDISPNSPEIKIISMILQFILVIAMLGGILEF